MPSMTVRNGSGQVASFYVDDENDPVATILAPRIRLGELERVPKGTKSTPKRRRGSAGVVDAHTEMRDEKGDYLKSVHGGGLDPDAYGDVLGTPSGSLELEGMATTVGGVSIAAVSQAAQRPASAPALEAAEMLEAARTGALAGAYEASTSAEAGADTATDDDQGGATDNGDDQGDDDAGPFNPGRHNVAQVTEHLAAADDDERARVMAAEAADRGRAGVLNWSPAS